ncbi:unnamed protein product [Candida verbasci]|uniref:Uncharacterized protein n=1 Tax=Candida verbasci TaxID=1227364 RepID=A0A9W4TUA9_9ASCO|nr:unnamed protein product [Candida verbasci]
MLFSTESECIPFKGRLSAFATNKKNPFWKHPNKIIQFNRKLFYDLDLDPIQMEVNIQFLNELLEKKLWSFILELRHIYVFFNRSVNEDAFDATEQGITVAVSKLTSNIPRLPMFMSIKEQRFLYNNFSTIFKQNKILNKTNSNFKSVKFDFFYKLYMKIHLDVTYQINLSIRNKYFNGNLMMLGIFLLMNELFDVPNDNHNRQRTPLLKARYQGSK